MTSQFWTEMVAALDRAIVSEHELNTAPSVEGVTALMLGLTPQVRAISCEPGRALPWGRYLVHADPAGRYNLQLDVFSAGYEGAIHGHGTWGIFWLVQGSLVVRDFEVVDGRARAQRAGIVGAGGGQCFCPPISDWHQVSTPATGPQTVSLHLYGPGFDLDEGVMMGADGPRSYRRGSLKDMAEVASALRASAAGEARG